MADLINRRDLQIAMNNLRSVTECKALVDKAPAITPQVVANISGGILQGASSDYPVDLYTLDFEDVPSDDPNNVIEVEGSEAYLGQTSTKIDPDFVRGVVEAEIHID